MVKVLKTFAHSRYERWDLKMVDDLLLELPITHNDHRTLLYVKKNADADGWLLVNYYYATKNNGGRAYSDGPSYQTCTRNTRALCAQNYHEDDDCVNAFPAILEQVALQCGVECICLSKYVRQRDELFAHLLKIYPQFDRDDVKGFFLIAMHMGDYKHHSDGVEVEFLNQFTKELKRLSTQLFDKVSDYGEIYRKAIAFGKQNAAGSAISKICQLVEAKIMKAKAKYTINVAKLDVYTDMFDGCFREKGFIDHKECSDYVFQKTGIQMKFVTKPIVPPEKFVPLYKDYLSEEEKLNQKIIVFEIEGVLGTIKENKFIARPGIEYIKKLKEAGYLIGIYSSKCFRQIPIKMIQEKVGFELNIVLSGEYCYPPTVEYLKDIGKKKDKKFKMKNLQKYFNLKNMTMVDTSNWSVIEAERHRVFVIENWKFFENTNDHALEMVVKLATESKLLPKQIKSAKPLLIQDKSMWYKDTKVVVHDVDERIHKKGIVGPIKPDKGTKCLVINAGMGSGKTYQLRKYLRKQQKRTRIMMQSTRVSFVAAQKGFHDHFVGYKDKEVRDLLLEPVFREQDQVTKKRKVVDEKKQEVKIKTPIKDGSLAPVFLQQDKTSTTQSTKFDKIKAKKAEVKEEVVEVQEESMSVLDQNKIIIQWESTYKLKDKPKFDIVIMDEVRSLMSNLICKETNKQHLRENAECSRAMMKNAKLSILMDADVEVDESVPLYVNSIYQPSEIEVHIYLANAIQRALDITNDKNEIEVTVRTMLAQGKTLGLICKTKQRAKDYEEMFKMYDVKIITSDTSDEECLKLIDINNYLKDCNLFIFTSKLTVGADIQLIFDKLFVDFMGGDGCNARICIQMIGRFRNLFDTNIVVAEDREPIKRYPSKIEITNYLRERSKFAEYCENIFSKNQEYVKDKLVESPDWFTNIYIEGEMENRQSQEWLLEHLAKKKGWQVSYRKIVLNERSKCAKEANKIVKERELNLEKTIFDELSLLDEDEIKLKIKQMTVEDSTQLTKMYLQVGHVIKHYTETKLTFEDYKYAADNRVKISTHALLLHENTCFDSEDLILREILKLDKTPYFNISAKSLYTQGRKIIMVLSLFNNGDIETGDILPIEIFIEHEKFIVKTMKECANAGDRRLSTSKQKDIGTGIYGAGCLRRELESVWGNTLVMERKWIGSKNQCIGYRYEYIQKVRDLAQRGNFIRHLSEWHHEHHNVDLLAKFNLG